MIKVGTRARVALGMFILSALAACGGDDAPVATAAFVPADGSAQVDIRPTIQVSFGAPVDASTATPDHVTLSQAGLPVPAVVTYDDARHAVTIAPLRALKHDAAYTVAVTGVVDAQGHSVPDASAKFTTWINAVVEDDAMGGLTIAGTAQPSSRVTTTLDASGHPGLAVTVGTTGTVSQCERFAYDNGLLASDTITAPGSDGTCAVAGEVFAAYQYVRDANGLLTSIVSADGAIAIAAETFAYDAHGNVTTDVMTSCGPDHLAGTADDQVQYSTTFTYDVVGRSINSFTSSGAPGTDIFGSLYVFVPGTAGAPDRTTTYLKPGPDGVWGTGDDVSSEYLAETLDSRGNVVIRQDYFISADGTPALVETVTNTYDSHDNLVTSVTTSGDGSGPVESTRTYDTTH